MDQDERPTTAIDVYDDEFDTTKRAQTAKLVSNSSSISSTPTTRPTTTGTLTTASATTSGEGVVATTDADADALRDRLIEDLDFKRRKLRVQGDIAAEATAACGQQLQEIHGDQSILIAAAREAGLFGDDRVLPGRMAEEKFAHELRDLADQMGVPDWLKEVDLAMKLREKSIASKIQTRELMDKVGQRANEANDTLEAVEKVSEKLQRNSEIIRTRIRDHFDKLRSVMRQRENILLGAVDQVATRKEKTLHGQRIEIADALSVVTKASDEAAESMDGDDIVYLHSFLSNLNDRLEVAAETFVNSKPYCTPTIPCQFGHSTLEGIIAGHGTVGDVEELAVGGPTGFGLLQWDASRTDRRLTISTDGHGIEHVGQTGKATSMSTTGFANGRNLWRIVTNGCKEGEWVSLGVCTAGLIGSAAYAQDSVIFSFQPSAKREEEETTLDSLAAAAPVMVKKVGSVAAPKQRTNTKYEITPTDVLAVSLDCATGSVEYYKNSVCIKTAMLFASPSPRKKNPKKQHNTAAPESTGSQTPRRSNREDEVEREVCWYPFATLYENGQSVRFDKVG